jgi:hypothetical protein
MRVKISETRQAREPFVDAGVVLHRAGAERIEARVDAEVPRGELREVPDELELWHLREAWRRLAAELVGDLYLR